MQRSSSNRRNIRKSNDTPSAKGAKGHTFQAKKSRDKKRKSHKRYSFMHRGLFLFISVVLLIYLCGYVFVFVNRAKTPVETVVYGTIDTPTQLKGIIIRDEYVKKSDKEGQPSYNYSENERVEKDAVICNIREGAATDEIENKIEAIDKDILKTQKNRKDLSPFQDDIDRIDSSIVKTVNNYAGKFMAGDISAMYEFRGGIDNSIDQRNQIWLAENLESTSQLSQKKNQYEGQLSKSQSAQKANKSGILSFYIDNMEEILTPETLDSVTKEQIAMKVTPEYHSKTKNVAPEETIFKIVSSNKWYIVSYMDSKLADDWEAGDTKILTASVDETEISFLAKVESLEIIENETRTVFSSTQSMIDFIGARHLNFKLKSDEIEGIKVPNSAIVEKILLKLPIECITENLGEYGVLKVSGNNTEFLKVTVSKFDREKGYAYAIQNTGGLGVGDVVMQGTGETAIKYTIAEVSTERGVFSANSAVAKFVMIDIIGQNSEYAIVRPGATGYELRAYDTIISDAKNIEEGQKV